GSVAASFAASSMGVGPRHARCGWVTASAKTARGPATIASVDVVLYGRAAITLTVRPDPVKSTGAHHT
ncbi:MAG: hypothetical protein LC659_11340, partial [Myxococcales bacterium]|nr:hypothetical protein [Myxococcales bacterium]